MEPDVNEGRAAQDISSGMVSIYKHYLGRGPTKARTSIRDDMVVTVLSDSLTPAEKSLSAADRGSDVREIRRTFQEMMAPDMRKLGEETLQREVISVLSDHDPEKDLAVEVLLLAPQ